MLSIIDWHQYDVDNNENGVFIEKDEDTFKRDTFIDNTKWKF